MNIDMSAGRLGAFTGPLNDFWAARNPRERRMITIALWAIGLAIVYLLLLEPAINGRARLLQQMPAMRQQVAQMQAMARELKAAPAAPRADAPVEAVTRESLEASLARAGLKAQSSSVTGEFIRLQFSDVSFASLVGWLDDARKNRRISVVEASVVAQSQSDRVNATLTLRQQRRE